MSNITKLPVTGVAAILAEAKQEVIEAKSKEAKTKIKDHLKKLDNAKLVVSNLERELEVMVAQIEADLK